MQAHSSELLTCTASQHQELTWLQRGSSHPQEPPGLHSTRAAKQDEAFSYCYYFNYYYFSYYGQASPGLPSWMKALLGSCRSLPLLGKLSLTELKKQAGLRK